MRHLRNLRLKPNEDLLRQLNISMRQHDRSYICSSADALLPIIRYMLDWTFYAEGKRKGTPIRSSYVFLKERMQEDIGLTLTETDYWFVLGCLDAIVVQRQDGLFIIVDNEGDAANCRRIQAYDRVATFAALDQLSRDAQDKRRRSMITNGLTALRMEWELLKFAHKLKQFQGSAVSQLAITDFLREEGALIGRIHDIKRIAAERGWFQVKTRTRKEKLELTAENEDFVAQYRERVGKASNSEALNAILIAFRIMANTPINNASSAKPSFLTAPQPAISEVGIDIDDDELSNETGSRIDTWGEKLHEEALQ